MKMRATFDTSLDNHLHVCVCVCVESVKNVWETHLCMTLCKLYNNYYTCVLIDIEDL